MRNKERIPQLTYWFETYWHMVGADLRFGQVLELMAQDYANCFKTDKPTDFFYIEDERWVEALKYGLKERGVVVDD